MAEEKGCRHAASLKDGGEGANYLAKPQISTALRNSQYSKAEEAGTDIIFIWYASFKKEKQWFHGINSKFQQKKTLKSVEVLR